ncbi:hypothetical protein BKA70DRAFT_1555794, partial [Coprinopsis sp. MPI-PUGE-AT-0042]
MSEIDDIFATKGKAKANPPATDAPAVKKPKKKKSKKQKNDTKDDQPKDQDLATLSSSKKRKAPETVVDPSQKIEGTSKRQKPNPESKKSTSKKDEAKFKDSRGMAGRRTTEEGFAIYKEDELNISHEGGGKPVVNFLFLPFTAWHQTLHCVPSIVTAVFEKMYTSLLDNEPVFIIPSARLFRSLPNRPWTMARGGQKAANINLPTFRQD